MRAAIITRSVIFNGITYSPREEGAPTKVDLPDEFRTDLPTSLVKFLDEIPEGVEPMNAPNATLAALAAERAKMAGTVDKNGIPQSDVKAVQGVPGANTPSSTIYVREELEARTVAQLEELVTQHPHALDNLRGSGSNGAVIKADLVDALLLVQA